MQMGLTLCPLSNLELKVVKDLKDHPIAKMMDRGLLVTLNSDDPAYFGGYMNENYLAIAEALNLSRQQITQLAKNGIKASWLSNEEKELRLEDIEQYYQNNR